MINTRHIGVFACRGCLRGRRNLWLRDATSLYNGKHRHSALTIFDNMVANRHAHSLDRNHGCLRQGSCYSNRGPFTSSSSDRRPGFQAPARTSSAISARTRAEILVSVLLASARADRFQSAPPPGGEVPRHDTMTASRCRVVKTRVGCALPSALRQR